MALQPFYNKLERNNYLIGLVACLKNSLQVESMYQNHNLKKYLTPCTLLSGRNIMINSNQILMSGNQVLELIQIKMLKE